MTSKAVIRQPQRDEFNKEIDGEVDEVGSAAEDHDEVAKLRSEYNAQLKQMTWTPAEEKVLLRRLDFYLIPLVMIMFFTLNLDRYETIICIH
jgi:hypothetical protein